MKQSPALMEAATSTFEALSFLLTTTEVSEIQSAAPLSADARISFEGPFNGELALRVYGDLLPELAANMTGSFEPLPEPLQYDALGEIANVICGNALPRIAGSDAVFRLSAPMVRSESPAAEPGARAVDAAVVLGVAGGRIELTLALEEAA